ncbi:MAG: low molecular weight phosphotyrosine protein phosphatase [Odoribacteraceae bacterium]|jgi:protein-tyrosine phosphatase|nr:low molecular weight phosphotyrosine protein phosphatase [Odoribacteraceae bacterium]
MDKTRILFVCLGNICRSPLAEAIMKRRLEERGLSGTILVDSAGTGGWHVGELPDERARRHGASRGYTVDSRARQFDPDTDFDAFDMVIGMDEQNVRDLYSMANSERDREKVHRATAFCRCHPGHAGVPDPYFGGSSGFELVVDMLEDVAEGILEHLAGKVSPSVSHGA